MKSSVVPDAVYGGESASAAGPARTPHVFLKSFCDGSLKGRPAWQKA